MGVLGLYPRDPCEKGIFELYSDNGNQDSFYGALAALMLHYSWKEGDDAFGVTSSLLRMYSFTSAEVVLYIYIIIFFIILGHCLPC